MYLRNYSLRKTWLLKYLKIFFSEHHSNSQQVKCSQTLLKPPPKHLYQIVLSHPRKLSTTIFPLVKSEILEMFINTLTVNDKYSLLNRENLQQPIQMQLFRK